MAASMIIEEETGTYVATRQHPHHGYYAGDFSRTPMPSTQHLAALVRMYPPTRARSCS